ncbi:MAG: TRAP transporter small permease subunit [Burkholderiaceae bacterium]
MTGFWRRIERLNEVLAMLALACLVCLPFLQVILRDFFSAPIVGLEEATRWGLIGLVYLALPPLLTQDGQIRFPELVNLPPRRLRHGLERFTLALAGLALRRWSGPRSVRSCRTTVPGPRRWTSRFGCLRCLS